MKSWLGIAFLIGELKADADYSMVLQQRDELGRQLQEERESHAKKAELGDNK